MYRLELYARLITAKLRLFNIIRMMLCTIKYQIVEFPHFKFESCTVI